MNTLFTIILSAVRSTAGFFVKWSQYFDVYIFWIGTFEIACVIFLHEYWSIDKTDRVNKFVIIIVDVTENNNYIIIPTTVIINNIISVRLFLFFFFLICSTPAWSNKNMLTINSVATDERYIFCTIRVSVNYYTGRIVKHRSPARRPLSTSSPVTQNVCKYGTASKIDPGGYIIIPKRWLNIISVRPAGAEIYFWAGSLISSQSWIQ